MSDPEMEQRGIRERKGQPGEGDTQRGVALRRLMCRSAHGTRQRYGNGVCMYTEDTLRCSLSGTRTLAAKALLAEMESARNTAANNDRFRDFAHTRSEGLDSHTFRPSPVFLRGRQRARNEIG